MKKKTSVLLESSHRKAIKQIMTDKGCKESEAIRHLLDRGVDYNSLVNLMEVTELKIFYYLRQIALTRGADFVNQVESEFEEVREDMLKSLREGISHVGK